MTNLARLVEISSSQGLIFHTCVYPGETLSDAIVRAGLAANLGGFKGYSIDCDVCGEELGENPGENCNEARHSGRGKDAE